MTTTFVTRAGRCDACPATPTRPTTAKIPSATHAASRARATAQNPTAAPARWVGQGPIAPSVSACPAASMAIALYPSSATANTAGKECFATNVSAIVLLLPRINLF